MNEIGTGILEELAFKDFSNVSSGRHLVYRSGTILAILVGGYLGNILVILVGSYLGKIPLKFESNWPKGLGGDSI